MKNYYDFEPIYYNDDFFYELGLKANKLYKGEGCLYERIRNYSTKRAIPSENLEKLTKKAIELAKKKSTNYFQNCFQKMRKL